MMRKDTRNVLSFQTITTRNVMSLKTVTIEKNGRLRLLSNKDIIGFDVEFDVKNHYKKLRKGSRK